ncbi:toll/interleukin-1 receptor domain-containing protein [Qipengyuania sp. DSG2-2]|uniref:toll/interleukin-1 receptor domain-containing protein n=1 Tax=Qipengyuania sp. DGS2-2 TaxID=3349631 RepID=UPI0036D23B05
MKLSKSNRVKLIKEISQRLAADEWTTIDLTLKQFGFPISSQWSSTTEAYVVEMISDGSDLELIELGQHLGIDIESQQEPTGTEPETPYWHDGQLRVFMSHLSDHREAVSELKNALSLKGMSAFVAHNDINPTAEWAIEIENALATCDLLIATIHPKFHESKWCDQEIGYALGRGVPVFAVRFGADPHGFVSRFQAFKGTGKEPLQIANELFEAAINHKKLQFKMADIVVERFINSGSFSAAKSRINAVESLKVWDASYTPRLEKAVRDNGQIKDSWGVPERVAELIKQRPS